MLMKDSFQEKRFRFLEVRTDQSKKSFSSCVIFSCTPLATLDGKGRAGRGFTVKSVWHHHPFWKKMNNNRAVENGNNVCITFPKVLETILAMGNGRAMKKV